MSQASELLNNLENQRIAASLGPEPHIIVGADRFITVPSTLKRLAVQGDHNIETVTFDCPRYWDNLDLYSMKVFVNYVRSDGVLGSFEVENKTIDESDENLFHFTWTISGNVTKVPGKLRFIVCAKQTNELGEDVHHWHSELNDETYISEGLDCGDSIVETLEPDIIMQILTRLDNQSASTSGPVMVVTIRENEGSDYYTPSHRVVDMRAWCDNGGAVILVHNRRTYTPGYMAGSVAIFYSLWGAVMYTVRVTDNLRVDGETDATASTDRLYPAPLTGSTTEITPAKVIEAMQAGIPLAITHEDSEFGSLMFNSFIVAVNDNAIQASGVFMYGGNWLAAVLIGDAISGEWLLTATLLQTAST